MVILSKSYVFFNLHCIKLTAVFFLFIFLGNYSLSLYALYFSIIVAVIEQGRQIRFSHNPCETFYALLSWHTKKTEQMLCLLAASTGIEPVFPPWEGGVLTPWPTGLITALFNAPASTDLISIYQLSIKCKLFLKKIS